MMHTTTMTISQRISAIRSMIVLCFAAELGLFVLSSAAYAQLSTRYIDGLRDKAKAYVVLTNLTLVPQPGEVIRDAMVIVRGAKIEAAGKNLSIPAGATVKDCNGMWCYAGFIEPYSSVGMSASEKGGPMGEDDESPNTPLVVPARHWNQAVKPELRAVEKLSLDEKSAEEFRRLGFTLIHTNSTDGIFRGKSAVVFAKQGTTHDITLAADVAQWMSFRKGSSKTPYPSSMMGSIALIRQTLSDAQWYGSAHTVYGANPAGERPELNVSLEALSKDIIESKLFVFETENEHSLMRFQKIASEFNLKALYEGNGYEYRRLPSLVAFKPQLILPLSFPGVPDVTSTERALDVATDDLLHWDAAPENPMRCDSVGLRFAFTTHQLQSKDDFLKNLRKAVSRGLKAETALAALTTNPASMLGLSAVAGTVKAGMAANLVLTSGDVFSDESVIRSVFVAGDEFIVSKPAGIDVRGTWQIKTDKSIREFSVVIEGKVDAPSATLKRDSLSIPCTFAINEKRFSLRFSGDSLGAPGILRFRGQMDTAAAMGVAVMADGKEVLWSATKVKPFTADATKGDDARNQKVTKADKPAADRALPLRYPNTPFGIDNNPAQQSVLFKNATVWTNTKDGIKTETDVLIKNGLISAVGKNLGGADVIVDATGKHLTAGMIDEHSHIAIEQGVNEGTHAVTAEVRIGDVVFPDDINIYRQLSGGVTSSHLLHGSANPIGGQLQLIKLRWGADADGLKFKEAAGTIKFALGENVKQANWGDRFSVRYPQTRMGVDEIMRDGFRTALEYDKRRQQAKAGGMPVRKDYQLETLLEIIRGTRLIHCHSYVQSEILMLMRLAEDFNFKVKTFTHILEGYKLAREMKEHGASASSFSDWWAYKYEVFDAVPENTGIMAEQGVVTSVNSDDAEMARRLNQEAAKAVKYGNVSEEEAWKMCTLNPAIQCGVDQYVGSVEAGKHADLVLWSGNPLSNFSRALQTYVDGRKYFDVEEDARLRDRDVQTRSMLEQRALRALSNGEEKAAGSGKPRRREYDCEDIFDEVQGSEEAH
ncbi:MAG: amidohydrolase family protein [Candidatus Kapaibacterium sp.]